MNLYSVSQECMCLVSMTCLEAHVFLNGYSLISAATNSENLDNTVDGMEGT